MAIKLLIVDDSALMRRQLAQIFEEEGDFEIRHARNGREAVEGNQAFLPDVITLDVNMPEMDGLTALSHILTARSVPVIMVSSLTEKGALATFEAMALGAVDYVPTPGGTISLTIDEIKAELIAKVRAAVRSRIRRSSASSVKGLGARLREERASAASPRPASRRSATDAEGLVIVGVSTGGPSTLEEILPKLPADYPFPVIVAQHMPMFFTGPFTARMGQLCALETAEVTQPLEVAPGRIYIGRGGTDTVVGTRSGKLVVMPRPESPKYLWHPSVEALGRSVLDHCEAEHVIGVMLTGMGYDGADAFTEIKKTGGRTIAESESSSVVFGMPKELIDRSGATLVLPAEKIASQLIAWAR